jgi:hypothetical protein
VTSEVITGVDLLQKKRKRKRKKRRRREKKKNVQKKRKKKCWMRGWSLDEDQRGAHIRLEPEVNLQSGASLAKYERFHGCYIANLIAHDF